MTAKQPVASLVSEVSLAPRLDLHKKKPAGVARFMFEEIGGRPFGASDYLALAARFDTILVENVPSMDLERRNEAKRFITLVDVLYEAKVKLVVSAQSEPQGLYRRTTATRRRSSSAPCRG